MKLKPLKSPGLSYSTRAAAQKTESVWHGAETHLAEHITVPLALREEFVQVAGFLPDEPGDYNLLPALHGARLMRGAAIQAPIRHNIVKNQQRAFLACHACTPVNQPPVQFPPIE